MPVLSLLLAAAVSGTEPNPPNWPGSVHIFRPGNDAQTQQVVNGVFQSNGGQNPPFHGQFVKERYAFLFMPGTHNVDVPVGYYTSVLGLGSQPTDTTIKDVYCENGSGDFTGGALSNFWRSAENFHTTPTKVWDGQPTPSMLWAVSQACPLRKLSVAGGLDLWEGRGYSSGGYLSDSTVSGSVVSGSQQQWYARNVDLGQWEGGVWNMVLQGTPKSPQPFCQGNTSQCLFTSIPTTPIIAEKPFITSADSKTFDLVIPQTEYNKVGKSTSSSPTKVVPFSDVYVAKDTDTADVINAKLQAGNHLILSPGVYNLTAPITVSKKGTVVLGIGFPTLISAGGNSVVKVLSGVTDVRVSGILLEAGPMPTKNLLEWGDVANQGPNEPSFIHDLFARVGGPEDQHQHPTQVKTMVEINAPNVVIDNSWLWRADHDVGGVVVDSNNPCDNGLVVNGDHTTAYALAVEHTLADLVQWNGNNGSVYFYQSELPYDVTQQNYGDQKFVSFRVADKVNTFTSHGMGAYSFFRDYNVTVASGFSIPNKPGVSCSNTFTIWLSGNGQISSVVNKLGKAVNSTFADQLSAVCSF
eukprot:TRINITY_DN2765_c2_g1_i1.p1 TRINITY_DN2765_c2_g1~~TRINITY_DN2765_c2_g1_i1.p1  ORF type:complete len:602 (+),score=151.16 TRINITY_DN2765_c2_g1_i1:66-1808(+)